jgi:hypothetical protein
MKLRSVMYGAVLLAGTALIPARASAQSCIYQFTLGLGGSISGCYTASISQLGEDALYKSDQYYWAGNFGGSSGATNAPVTAGTLMFNNDCGSAGSNSPGTFAFCQGGFAKTPASFSSLTGELVLGLDVVDDPSGLDYWIYSGAATRNAVPAPVGYQEVLLQLTLGGVDQAGQFLYGWEDLNSGCSALATSNNRFAIENLSNGLMLESQLNHCTASSPVSGPPKPSDDDYNDSYLLLSVSGTGVGTNAVTPEPMTMSLMAFGLVAMAGVSTFKRRRRS